MKLYAIDDTGQITHVHRETGFHYKNYIISPYRYPLIKERRPSRYTLYETYANEDGSPSTNSTTTKPWDYGLAEEVARVGMIVCFFYREHHHYAGTKALLLRITELDDRNQAFHATMIDCGYINRMRNSPYWSLIQHGDHNLTTRSAVPYNQNNRFAKETLFLHPRGASYFASTQIGIKKWKTDNVQSTLFGHLFYDTTGKSDTVQFIALQPVTYHYVQFNTRKFFNRVLQRWRYDLKRCVVRGGRDIITVTLDNVMHVLTHDGGKAFRLVPLTEDIINTSIKKVIPLILPEWDVEKSKTDESSTMWLKH